MEPNKSLKGRKGEPFPSDPDYKTIAITGPKIEFHSGRHMEDI